MSQSVPVQTTCPCSKKTFKDFKRHSKSKTHEKWVKDTLKELLPLLTPIDQLPPPPEWMLKDEDDKIYPICHICEKNRFKSEDEYYIDDVGIVICNECDNQMRDYENEVVDDEEICKTCHKFLDHDDDKMKCGEGCPEYDAGWKETHDSDSDDDEPIFKKDDDDEPIIFRC